MAPLRILMTVAAGLCLAAPVQAQSIRDVLYASDGPAVRGLSYCHQVLSDRADPDRLARQYGFLTPLNQFGSVDVLDEPRGPRRSWRVNYSGTTAGTAGIPDDDALSMSVRLRGHDCEVTILGVPLSEESRVLDVTTQILAQLDPQFVPDPMWPFSRILVAGTGPSWHGTIRLVDDTFDAGISFGPRIAPYAGAIWQLDLVNLDRLRSR